jgi:hypothetical protein
MSEMLDGGNATVSVKVYDPDHQVWITVGPMRSKRIAHTMTRLQDGRMLVSGGDDGFDNAYGAAELGTTAPLARKGGDVTLEA